MLESTPHQRERNLEESHMLYTKRWFIYIVQHILTVVILNLPSSVFLNGFLYRSTLCRKTLRPCIQFWRVCQTSPMIVYTIKVLAIYHTCTFGYHTKKVLYRVFVHSATCFISFWVSFCVTENNCTSFEGTNGIDTP